METARLQQRRRYGWEDGGREGETDHKFMASVQADDKQNQLSIKYTAYLIGS